MADRSHEAGTSGITVRHALGRVAEQLEASALRLDTCQAAIGDILPANLAAETIEALQNLDAATQIVRELSLALGRVAVAGSCEGRIADAFVGVRLADLRNALLGVGDRAMAAPQAVELW